MLHNCHIINIHSFKDRFRNGYRYSDAVYYLSVHYSGVSQGERIIVGRFCEVCGLCCHYNYHIYRCLIYIWKPPFDNANYLFRIYYYCIRHFGYPFLFSV